MSMAEQDSCISGHNSTATEHGSPICSNSSATTKTSEHDGSVSSSRSGTTSQDLSTLEQNQSMIGRGLARTSRDTSKNGARSAGCSSKLSTHDNYHSSLGQDTATSGRDLPMSFQGRCTSQQARLTLPVEVLDSNLGAAGVGVQRVGPAAVLRSRSDQDFSPPLANINRSGLSVWPLLDANGRSPSSHGSFRTPLDATTGSRLSSSNQDMDENQSMLGQDHFLFHGTSTSGNNANWKISAEVAMPRSRQHMVTSIWDRPTLPDSSRSTSSQNQLPMGSNPPRSGENPSAAAQKGKDLTGRPSMQDTVTPTAKRSWSKMAKPRCAHAHMRARTHIRALTRAHTRIPQTHKRTHTREHTLSDTCTRALMHAN